MLIYLALQIRQNTAALQTESRQAISTGYKETNRLRIDPRAGLAWAKGLKSFPHLPLEDRMLFGTIMIDEALFFQGAFAIYESGQLEEATYVAYLDWFSSVVATPGGGIWWETTGRPIYTHKMVAAVDQRLSAGNLHDVCMLPAMRLDEPPASEASGDPAGALG